MALTQFFGEIRSLSQHLPHLRRFERMLRLSMDVEIEVFESQVLPYLQTMFETWPTEMRLAPVWLLDLEPDHSHAVGLWSLCRRVHMEDLSSRQLVALMKTRQWSHIKSISMVHCAFGPKGGVTAFNKALKGARLESLSLYTPAVGLAGLEALFLSEAVSGLKHFALLIDSSETRKQFRLDEAQLVRLMQTAPFVASLTALDLHMWNDRHNSLQDMGVLGMASHFPNLNHIGVRYGNAETLSRLGVLFQERPTLNSLDLSDTHVSHLQLKHFHKLLSRPLEHLGVWLNLHNRVCLQADMLTTKWFIKTLNMEYFSQLRSLAVSTRPTRYYNHDRWNTNTLQAIVDSPVSQTLKHLRVDWWTIMVGVLGCLRADVSLETLSFGPSAPLYTNCIHDDDRASWQQDSKILSEIIQHLVTRPNTISRVFLNDEIERMFSRAPHLKTLRNAWALKTRSTCEALTYDVERWLGADSDI